MDSVQSSLTTVFQFEVVLKFYKPRIWRRIEVPGYFTFFELHVAIQDAMNWSGHHLHRFEMVKSRISKKEYIGIPDRVMAGFVNILSENQARLSDHFSTTYNKCIYTYNFASEWVHEITLKKILPSLDDVKYPRCTGGRRQTPLQEKQEGKCDEGKYDEPFFWENQIIFRDAGEVWKSFQQFGKLQ